jgi:parallel beta-helix repeat protein
VKLIQYALMIALLSAAAQAATIKVESGRSIQDAIDMANFRDLIEVHSGVYRENVDVHKSLTLRGIDTGGGIPVIDAGGSEYAFILSAGGSTIQGFDIRNSDLYSGAGVKVTSDGNLVTGNKISKNARGIELAHARNNRIEANSMANNGIGVRLIYSESNSILVNTGNDNDFGVFAQASPKNVIQGNSFIGSTYKDIYDDSENNGGLMPNSGSIPKSTYGRYSSSEESGYLVEEYATENAGSGSGFGPAYQDQLENGFPWYGQSDLIETIPEIEQDQLHQPHGELKHSGILLPEKLPGSATTQIGPLIDHSMVRGIMPSGEPTGRTSSFSRQERKAYSWVRFGPLYEGHAISWDWFSPDGSVYSSSEGTIPDPRTQGQAHLYSPMYWSELSISGTPAEGMPGNWKVEFYLDGASILTERFTLV